MVKPGGRKTKVYFNITKRWRDDLNAHCNGWFEVTLEKTTWKDVGEAFAQQWDIYGKLKKKVKICILENLLDRFQTFLHQYKVTLSLNDIVEWV